MNFACIAVDVVWQKVVAVAVACYISVVSEFWRMKKSRVEFDLLRKNEATQWFGIRE